MRETTEELIRLVSSARQTKAISLSQITDIGNFVKENFDYLDLSLLYQRLKGIDDLETFNAYMAWLNKYDGFPKEFIPFELDLQDYVLADKIMKKISL